MAGNRKHGSHAYDLSLPALAACAAADTSNVYPWDAYADAGPTIAVSGTPTTYNAPYDQTAEEIFEFGYTLEATLTGQITNFSAIAARLIRGAAVLNDTGRLQR